MLQIKDVRKKYVTGDLVQTALDGVSLNLRENEFVAILGPSGSGKTTLLNVIGGLDRYDSGDLIINGISTKEYSDRDWDSYRNHTIGFVFQSYNLIPHQTVLANVELALTISGISRAERKQRAIRALQDVGLGNQLHKRPNQMSGGQMQRVAIARALVNDPDILLADEPTGALDSETSIQVMDLLKKVSENRLVVMVTHNPELAESYANRIVRVKDGRIIGDTNPFLVDEAGLAPPEHRNMGRASMSFLTALSLSFNNLWTKKARTLLTAFAGSIGIIGIALIMSISSGFQSYIDKIQTDTLSGYPLVIQSETADMTSMLAMSGGGMAADEETETNTVSEMPMISRMFANIGSNDLSAFKLYLDENWDSISHALNAVKYSYGVTPRIYSADTSEGILQANPATVMSSLMGDSPMTAFMSTDVFMEMIDNRELLESQYDVLMGRWPEDYHELIVVLSNPGRIPDYMAYTLGLKDPKLLDEMIQKVMNGEEVELQEEGQWSYEDFMSLRFKLISPAELYRYNEEYAVWEDMSTDEAFMKELIAGGEDLEVVGIITPKDDSGATALSTGVAYSPELTRHVIELAEGYSIVQNQLEDQDVDVFTGTGFDEETESKLDFADMISVDSDAISSAFGMDIDTQTVINMLTAYLNEAMASIDVDTTGAEQAFVRVLGEMSREMLRNYIAANADPSGTARLRLSDVTQLVSDYLAGDSAAEKLNTLTANYSITNDVLLQVYQPLLAGLASGYIASNLVEVELPVDSLVPETVAFHPEPLTVRDQPASVVLLSDLSSTEDGEEPSETPEEPSETPEEPSETPEEPSETPEEPSETPEEPDEPADPTLPGLEIDPEQIYAEISEDDVEPWVSEYLNTAVVDGVTGAMGTKMMEGAIRNQLMNKIAGFGSRLMGYVQSSFRVDTEKLSSAFQFNMNEDEIRRLMEAMSGRNKEHSARSNLQSLGYAKLDDPVQIEIYMKDFAAKEEFLQFLDEYNLEMERLEQEDRVIRYTDATGVMMSSIRTIIDSVSYVLIAFVAVSLVVSSIMIGIITYISVMERTKEIGVLRAIGASKHNITQVFNAETFIIGLCSGLIGIGVTLMILIPGNQILHSLTNNPDITAQLPVVGAMVLVGLSVLLTLIGGLIPAGAAAKKDPVIALRSE